MPSVLWEYWGDFTCTRDLIEFYGGRPGHTPEPYTLRDNKPVKHNCGLTAKGVPLTDMLGVKGCMNTTGLETTSFPMADGSGPVVGIPTNFTATPIPHTNKYDIKIAVRQDGSGTALWQYYGGQSGSRELMELYNPAPGVPTVYDLLNIHPAKISGAISTKGALPTELTTVLNGLTSPSPTSFSLADGSPVAGMVTNYSSKLIDYTELYDISATIRVDGAVSAFDGAGVQWYAYGSHTMEKELGEFYEAPNNGAYGAVTFYSVKRPKYSVQVTAEGVPEGGVTALLALIQSVNPNDSFSFGAFTGNPVSASLEPVKHTGLYNARVTLRIS